MWIDQSYASCLEPLKFHGFPPIHLNLDLGPGQLSYDPVHSMWMGRIHNRDTKGCQIHLKPPKYAGRLPFWHHKYPRIRPLPLVPWPSFPQDCFHVNPYYPFDRDPSLTEEEKRGPPLHGYFGHMWDLARGFQDSFYATVPTALRDVRAGQLSQHWCDVDAKD